MKHKNHNPKMRHMNNFEGRFLKVRPSLLNALNPLFCFRLNKVVDDIQLPRNEKGKNRNEIF